MKKIVLALIMSCGIFSMVSADIGVKVGVSAQVGSMEGKGSETNRTNSTTRTSENKEALFATAGIFIEKDLAFLPGRLGEIGSRVSLGYDNIANDLDFGSATNNRRVATLGAAGAAVLATEHKLSAKVTGMETIYATININDWLYVKAGEVTVDFDATFVGSATSSYKKGHELDGTVVGFGVEKISDNGMFFRLEYNDYNIDGKSVQNGGTDSVFTAKLHDITGQTGRIAIGKAF